jgi:Rieske Fe-S protein
MQPKIKSKVSCSDRVVGEVSRVVADPITHEISHLVVSVNGGEVLVPAGDNISSVTENEVRLNLSSDALTRMPPFRREEFVSVEDVEIAHLERRLEVHPGEALVPLPELEKDIPRRTFLNRFTNTIGAVMGFSLLYPVFRYLTFPMYEPFNNSWLTIGNVAGLGKEDVPAQVRFHKTVKEGFLVREFEKSQWVLKTSPEMREKIYHGKGKEFRKADGSLLWVNPADSEIVVFSSKCTHLGCAYRWRFHRRFGKAFICPCHLSVFGADGEVLDGPAPRPLDILPSRVNSVGNIEIIDMEFKAGKAEEIRIV